MSGTATPGPALRALRDARDDERAGRIGMAIEKYQGAIDAAIAAGDAPTQSEALRRLAVAMHRQLERGVARELCEQSFEVAHEIGDQALAAEALNTLGGFELEAGQPGNAGDLFRRALAMSADNPALLGRIEQNLGIIANIRGDLPAALAHYERSLAAFDARARRQRLRDRLPQSGHDQRRPAATGSAADDYFDASLALADSLGDVRLRGLCLLNRTEVFIARQRFEEARVSAEDALRHLRRAGCAPAKGRCVQVPRRRVPRDGPPGARRGAAHERDRPRARSAARRWARRRHRASWRSCTSAWAATRRRCGCSTRRTDCSSTSMRASTWIDVTSKASELEGTYLAVVRDWGQSIESADCYTYGHCERVATYAVAVARALGLDAVAADHGAAWARTCTTSGKVRVPHEILNKPGQLTREEFELMKLHPLYGLDLLEGVEFPWDIKPLIRWHHEKYDGTGYPDRLRGDEIPIEAQIIGIVDVYDALTRRAAIARRCRSPRRWRSWPLRRVVAGGRGGGSPRVHQRTLGGDCELAHAIHSEGVPTRGDSVESRLKYN